MKKIGLFLASLLISFTVSADPVTTEQTVLTRCNTAALTKELNENREKITEHAGDRAYAELTQMWLSNIVHLSDLLGRPCKK